MRLICWIVVLLAILFFSSVFLKRKQNIEKFTQIHGNKFWNYWNTPVINKYKYYPNWANPYWGPSYFPGGPKVNY